MSLQEFIGVIKAEAEHYLKQHARETNYATSLKVKNNKGKGKPLLLKHITNKLKDIKMSDNEKMDKKPKPYCKHCKTKGHTANDCDKQDEDPCIHYGQYNHKSDDCWHKDKPK